MYDKYFGLEELPFSIAPDPRYLYMSEQHREALAHLIYCFNSDGGFVLLTGEVGTGKTTVCRCLLEQIEDSSAIAFILNPKLTVEDLLATVCDEFGIRYPEGNRNIKVFIDLINAFLLEAHKKGRKSVLIIDEAQNLGADVLEQLRLLTNLETSRHKLLQIILLGQPELRENLSRKELRQLSQRIIARYHLGPLSKKDVGAYVSHRLSVAGLKKELFNSSSINELCKLSGGVPRLINVLCDRALLGTYTQGKETVSKSTLKKAADEVFGKNGEGAKPLKFYVWMLPLLALLVVGAVLASSYYRNSGKVSSGKPGAAVAVKPAAAPVPETPANLVWPENIPVKRSWDMAFSSLLKQWDITPGAEDKASCETAAERGLICEDNRGSMKNLLLLNRPAVLKLYDEKGSGYHITLTGIEDEKANIVIGNEERKVHLSEIEDRWLGDYTILWRVPPGYSKVISPGDTDPLVSWLERQLALIQGRNDQSGGRPVFDEALVASIKEFQLAQGLVPDGIIGTRTLININTLVDPDIPTLTASGGNK